MIVEWNDCALASVERQSETYQSAKGDTRTKLTPRSWEWSIDTLESSKYVTWCFTPRQPLRSFKGDSDLEHHKVKTDSCTNCY